MLAKMTTTTTTTAKGRSDCFLVVWQERLKMSGEVEWSRYQGKWSGVGRGKDG